MLKQLDSHSVRNSVSKSISKSISNSVCDSVFHRVGFTDQIFQRYPHLRQTQNQKIFDFVGLVFHFCDAELPDFSKENDDQFVVLGGSSFGVVFELFYFS